MPAERKTHTEPSARPLAVNLTVPRWTKRRMNLAVRAGSQYIVVQRTITVSREESIP